MVNYLHVFPGLYFLLFGLGLQIPVTRWALERYSTRAAVWGATAVSVFVLGLGYLFEFARVLRYFSAATACWVQFGALFWTACLLGLLLGSVAWRRAPEFRPQRRRFLEATGAALCAA